MSKPKRILLGTSGKLLLGVILLSILSHSSGTKGVTMASNSGEVALLSGVGGGAT